MNIGFTQFKIFCRELHGFLYHSRELAKLVLSLSKYSRLSLGFCASPGIFNLHIGSQGLVMSIITNIR